MEFLRDPIWQFIGVIIALTTSFVSILFYLRKPVKRLVTYTIISDTPISSIKDDLKSKIKVLFEGKLVENAHLVLLRVSNSGKSAIKPEDYIVPVKFDFGTAELLSAEILTTIPEDLGASVNIEHNNLELKPLLLNSEDTIIMRLLVSNFNGKISVHGRIVDIKQIFNSEVLQKAKPSYRLGYVMGYFSALYLPFLGSLALIYLVFLSFFGEIHLIWLQIGLILAILICAYMLLTLFMHRK